ncbi:MAG: YfaZ family outer membrane protein [Campylobacterota bacterium]|nr:YfaZ family outer membrane protein [Campylobacterota bacterium]
MPFSKLLSLLLLSTVLLFSRSTVGLNVNTEDFELEGAMDITTFSEYTNGTIFIADANFINTEYDTLFGIGLGAHNSFQGMEGLNLGLGIRYVYIEDFMALPLMIEASYGLPLIDAIPSVSLSASMLYAPSALSFDEAENYFEFRLEAGIEVISSVGVYIGYRDIEIEYLDSFSENLDNSYETFNSSFYGGLKMSF